MAEPTLIELIDNNKYVLENKIKDTMITRFLDLMMKNNKIKYIKLLRVIINCDGHAITKNQA